MINFTTKQEYQGNNIDLLQGLGDEFCTFRQAVKFFNNDVRQFRDWEDMKGRAVSDD